MKSFGMPKLVSPVLFLVLSFLFLPDAIAGDKVIIETPSAGAKVRGVVPIHGVYDAQSPRISEVRLEVDHQDVNNQRQVVVGDLCVVQGTLFSVDWDTTNEKIDGQPLPNDEYTIRIKAMGKNHADIIDETDVKVILDTDRIPPVVQITSIQPNAVIQDDNVDVAGTATDNVGVDTVQFDIEATKIIPIPGKMGQNLQTFHGDAQLYGFQWDDSKIAEGNYKLVMVASDKAGNSALSVVPITIVRPKPFSPGTPGQLAPGTSDALDPALSEIRLDGTDLEDISRNLSTEDLKGKKAVLSGSLKQVSGLDHLEVSLDGGLTWQRIEAAPRWTYSFEPVPNRDYDIKFRAVQKNGTHTDLQAPRTRFHYKPNENAVSEHPQASAQGQTGSAVDTGNAKDDSSWDTGPAADKAGRAVTHQTAKKSAT